MRPPPTTLEILEVLALRDPQRLVLMEDGIALSRGQFHAMAVNCAAQLRGLGIRPRDRVAVSGPGFARQLLALFACEALGAVTASFQHEGDCDAPVLFQLVDWILAGRPQDVPAGKRFVLIDDAFLRALAQPPRDEDRAWHALQDGELQRITRTSGSTGRSKFIAMSRRAQEYWVRGTGVDDVFGQDSRLLVTGPLVINAAFTRTTRCLRNGGAVMTGSGADIARMDPTDVWGLPLQIERLLGEMPPDWQASRPVPVATVGGAVGSTLRERLQRVFGGGYLPNRYGGNEVGPICDTMDASGTGLLSPGVDLRIVGPDGNDLPPGQFGAIVVRTPGMADGYLGLPEENAAAFRDGWFHSADVGALVGPRLLRLVGRQDDLLNLGGIKVPVSAVEAALRRQPAVADCAVLAVNLRSGTVSVGVVVVLAPGATEDEAKTQLACALAPDVTTTVAVRFLDRLPVLQAGKLDRMALQRAFLGMA